MSSSLYDQIKKFAKYLHEQRDKANTEENVLKTILFRTLSLLADMNVSLMNFPEARKAIKDLELLQKNDADT